ncbi:MAG: hypothetical protein ACQESE_02735 [Nanobdellota archaeon]
METYETRNKKDLIYEKKIHAGVDNMMDKAVLIVLGSRVAAGVIFTAIMMRRKH